MKQKILEKDITQSIRQYLNIKHIFHWKVWQGLGSTKGVSDIVGILPDGQFFCIEVKAPKGILSQYQSEFIDNVKRNKGVAIVAHSPDDVIKILEIKQ